MQLKNPFNPGFGGMPNIFITSLETPEEMNQQRIIESSFNRIIFITGIRGSGKTTFQAKSEQLFENNEQYLPIDLDNDETILDQALIKLRKANQHYHKWKITSIKSKYLSIDIAQESIQSEEIKEEIIKLNKQGITPIFYIDEISASKEVIQLVRIYNSLNKQGYRIFFVLAGLPSLIDSLQRLKNLTFLKRADKIMLRPFNLKVVASKYYQIFETDQFTANELAKQTGGYSYAFQLLGYLVWKNRDEDLLNIAYEITSEYKNLLFNNSYDEIIDGLSSNDLLYIKGIAKYNGQFSKIKTLYQNKNRSYAAQYRRRLLDQHLIKSTQQNQTAFTLPYFKDYLKDRMII